MQNPPAPIKYKVVIVVAVALGWAFVVDPLIDRLTALIGPPHEHFVRRCTEFIAIILASLIVYRRILKKESKTLEILNEYRRLLDDIPVPMFIFDSRTFRFLNVNTAAICQYGYSREEFLRLKITDLRPPEEVPAFLAAIGNVQNTYTDVGRWLHLKKNGETFYVQVFSHHTIFEGIPVKQSVVIDIDKKVQTERELAEKTAELENVLESMTDAFYTVDHNWNFTYINKKYEQVQGRNREKLLGKNVWELFPYGKELRYFKEYSRAMHERISVHFEEFNTFNKMWVSASAYPIKSGLAIYFRDITEEKLMREKIAKDSHNLRAIINNTKDLIWSVDHDFNIITGNGAFWERVERLTGKQPDTITNADFEQEIMRPVLESYERAFKGEAFSLVRERELEGQKHFEELSFNPIVNERQQVTGVNCFLRDITAQHQHLAQIENQNKKFRRIAWIQSHQLRVPVANILGLAELIGSNCSTKEELIQMFCSEAKRLDKMIREITMLTEDI